MADRVYRDPVLGSISFDRDTEGYVIELVDTPEFQRLRRVRQLGAAFLVFHGAEHSRFTHSVGVAYLAKRIFSRLTQDSNFPNDIDQDELKKAVVAGALLHDIGHGPFSHLFERVFDQDHEAWGLRIIEEPETQIHQVLEKYKLVDAVKKILAKTFKPRFARDIISSQLDADRLDYLLRDSYMTGVAYGRYDLDWLLEVIELGRIPTNGKDLGLTVNFKKGWHAAEQFVIGRYLMYQQVYFHKTIRSAERMIKLVFERLTDMGHEHQDPKFCPDPLKKLLNRDRGGISASTYLALDDEFMLACMNLWATEEAEDTVLRDLCSRLLKRNLFKTAVIDQEKIKDHIKYASAINALQDAMRESGFNPKYYLAFDSAEDFAYRDMMWFVAKEKSPEDIWLAEDGEAKQPLSNPTVSPLIDSVRNKATTTRRMCYPAELKTLVSKHLQQYLSDLIDVSGTAVGMVAEKPSVESVPETRPR